MELKPNRIVAETMAGKACPVDGVFAFLDVLLGRAATTVEPGDALGWPRQVGDDETDLRIKLARMPLDLGHQSA